MEYAHYKVHNFRKDTIKTTITDNKKVLELLILCKWKQIPTIFPEWGRPCPQVKSNPFRWFP
jgi:hypothetical protein